MTTDGNDRAFAKPDDSTTDAQQGLTKREYFAAIALQGLLTNPKVEEMGDVCFGAVQIADAFIKELNK